MPFIPPNPDLSKLPPKLRERVYRDHREFLERQIKELRSLDIFAAVLVTLVIASGIAAFFGMQMLETSP